MWCGGGRLSQGNEKQGWDTCSTDYIHLYMLHQLYRVSPVIWLGAVCLRVNSDHEAAVAVRHLTVGLRITQWS
jgi:hypothetical protein